MTSLFLIFPVPSNRTGLAVTPWTPFSTLNREPCNTQLGSRPATGLTACADSEGTSVRWVPGVLGERGGKAELAAQTFFPAVPNTPSRPAAPAVPAPSPSPGPARPGPGLPSAPHSPHTPRLLHAGPRQARAAGPGGTAWVGSPGAGWGVSPGRGWVPQRRFQLFRCLKLAPAERCGHVTERRQSAPACLRVPAPNARRPEERRPRPGGRVRRAPGARGAAGGTRERAGGRRRAASGLLRPGPPSRGGRLPSGAAHVTHPVSAPLCPSRVPDPTAASVRRVPRPRGPALRPAPGRGLPPRPPGRPGDRCSFIYTLGGVGGTGADPGRPGRPFPGPTVRWRGSTE